MNRVVLLHPHGGMGDLLLSYPVIQAFANRFPGCTITYVTPPGMEEVVQGHPAVSEAFSLPPGNAAAFHLSKTLRARKIDVACALWTTGRVAWLLWLSGIPIRIGQSGRVLYSFLFTHRVRVRSAAGDASSHWVECLLDYPRSIGIEPADKTITLRPSLEGVRKAEALLEGLGIAPGEPIAVIHPGKGEEVWRRGWPVRLFAEVGEDLRQSGFRVIFTGSQREADLVEAVRGAMRDKGDSLAGKTDFQTLAALLSFSRILICPDSGPMHVAAAVKTPVVAIFAMKKDFPDRWAPWDVPHEIVRPVDFPCRPWCTKETCPDFRCYGLLSPAPIAAAARALAEKKSRERGFV